MSNVGERISCLSKFKFCIIQIKLKYTVCKTYFKAIFCFAFLIGDIVGLYANKSGPSEMLESGIVSFSKAGSIGVAFNEELEDLNSNAMYRLMKLTNNVTYKRLNM